MGTPVLVRDRLRIQASPIWLETALITGLVVLLYSEVIPDLVSDWWTQPALSYGLLIPPLALYIAGQRRDVTFSIPAKRSWGGCWLVAFACLVFLAGSLSAPLQLFPSLVATDLSQVRGVTVYRDCNIIQLAQISRWVAGACSVLAAV